MKEVLQKDFERVLKAKEALFTRLRTPNYGFKGVRYPADYVLWLPNITALVECKQRKALPIAPSDIRQLPFMQEWENCSYMPKACYYLLTSTEEGYCLFLASTVVSSAQEHRGLRLQQAFIHTDTLSEMVDKILSI